MGRRRGRVLVVMAAAGAVGSLSSVGPAWAVPSEHLPAVVREAGSDPNSAFCKLERQTQKDSSSKLEIAATDALISGNWATAQKDLLAVDAEEVQVARKYKSVISSLSGKVKAAAEASLAIVPAEEKATKDSTSAAQFEAATEKALQSAKFSAAASVLAAYENSECGTTIGASDGSTTTTTP